MPPAFPATGIALEWRRPYAEETTLFLIGPGGVGKSTLGKALAARLGWELIDLDLVFCDRLAIIGDFIATHGYGAYHAANLALAETLVAGIGTPTIFVTASGFLVAPPESEDFRRASTLVGKGYAIRLLPSDDIDIATELVVDRQLQRGFGFNRADETEKFRTRFALYRPLGDLQIGTARPADEIAARLERVLRRQ